MELSVCRKTFPPPSLSTLGGGIESKIRMIFSLSQRGRVGVEDHYQDKKMAREFI